MVCGVAGAELVLAGGNGDGDRPGKSLAEEEQGESQGPLIKGSDTLLVKGCSWSLTAPPPVGGWLELWSEAEDRLSMLIAGEGEEEEG